MNLPGQFDEDQISELASRYDPSSIMGQIETAMGPTKIDGESIVGGSGMYNNFDGGGNKWSIKQGKIYQFDPSAAIPPDVLAKYPMASAEEMTAIKTPDKPDFFDNTIGQFDKIVPDNLGGALMLMASFLTAGTTLAGTATPWQTLTGGGGVSPDLSSVGGSGGLNDVMGSGFNPGSATTPVPPVGESFGWPEAIPDGTSITNPNATLDYTQDLNQVGGNGSLTNPDYTGTTNGGVFNPGSTPGLSKWEQLVQGVKDKLTGKPVGGVNPGSLTPSKGTAPLDGSMLQLLQGMMNKTGDPKFVGGAAPNKGGAFNMQLPDFSSILKIGAQTQAPRPMSLAQIIGGRP